MAEYGITASVLDIVLFQAFSGLKMYSILCLFLMPLLAFGEQPCQEALQEYQSAMANSEWPLLGAEEPRCDENGEYRDRICRGTDCWCVMPNGDEIADHHHRRFEINEEEMECKCARTRESYMRTGLIGLRFRCTPEGNYSPIQCTGSMCYCADSNGQQVGESLPVWRIREMQCD